MAVETIGRTPTATTTTQAAGIGQDDFLKILLTQMNYQDPLKPMDNQQFVAQMAQFTALEQTRQANDHLENLLTIQSATQSIGLIGRTVQISTASGSTLGEVTAMALSFSTFNQVLSSHSSGLASRLLKASLTSATDCRSDPTMT